MQSGNDGAGHFIMVFALELRPQKTVKSCVSGEVYVVPSRSGHGEEGELLCLTPNMSPPSPSMRTI